MPNTTKTKTRLLTCSLAAAFLTLTACDAGQPPLEQGALYGSSIGGAYELVDAQGQIVRASDFEGQWQVVYFGYAYCPDVCPFDMQRMIKGLALYAEQEPELAANVQPIFITVDPERDTPEVIREFTSNFSDDLVGLTGTPEQVAQAAKAFSVYYNKGEVNEQGGYLMDHSNAAYLLDPQGQAIALVPVDQSPEAVAAELALWVR